MEVFGTITIADLITTFVVSVLAMMFVSMVAASWRWALHFISTTRRQRQRENYVETRRRIRNIDYLVFKEKQASNQMQSLGILSFAVLMLLLSLGLDDRTIPPIAALLYIVAAFIPGAFVFIRAIVERARNEAARAFRAGLRRDRRTKQFAWPPTKTPGRVSNRSV